MVEWKLMLVPVFFIILRVWTLATTIKFVYLQPSTDESIPAIDYWLFYVGVSGLLHYIRIYYCTWTALLYTIHCGTRLYY